jgi:hypothetical protein
MKNNFPIDKKRQMREMKHTTAPPRMEGKVKNAKMNSVRKPKRK